MEALALQDWTREEYRRAAETGLFRPEEKLELIDGQIVTKTSPQGKPHSICVIKTAAWLNDVIVEDAYVIIQGPIALGEKDGPEPDVALIWGTPDADLEEHASAHKVVLIVEVADSSLARDRRLEIPRHAAAGIPEAGSSTWRVGAWRSTASSPETATASSRSWARTRRVAGLRARGRGRGRRTAPRPQAVAPGSIAVPATRRHGAETRLESCFRDALLSSC